MSNFGSETLTIDGVDVQVKYYYDSDSDAPWDNADGHGPVRVGRRNYWDGSTDKRPGERPMNQPERSESLYLYDWQEACKLATKDGWNTEPYDAPNRVQRAVQSDFDFLRGWVNDDWCYVGVEVQVLDEGGEPVGDSDSLWGVETYKNYHKEQAKEMAQDLVDAHKREIAERLACEERDIVTV